jgi:uncharacterized protein
MNSKDSKQVIDSLGLLPHPEGGYFREIYRSEGYISYKEQNINLTRKRNLATSIYYLLESGQVSKLHRLKSDEIWYYHGGSPMEVICLYNDQISTIMLGMNFEEGQVPQLIIKSGTIFGAKPSKNNSFSLVGCLVVPGFDFKDFEFVGEDEIHKSYPDSLELLNQFINNN